MMAGLFHFFIFSFVVCVCLGSGLPKEYFNTVWTYNETYAAEKGLAGPNEWKNKWVLCRADGADTHQSPINIQRETVVVDSAGVLPLTFAPEKCNAKIQNIGATLSISPEVKQSSFTTASGTKYILNEVHIHWEQFALHNGTEHWVDSQGEAAEIHLVHYNAAFPSLEAALEDNSVGNIAVLAVRYNVAENNEQSTTVPAFEMFSDSATKLLFMDLETTLSLDGVTFYDLLGENLPRVDLPMFHYNGSLTTPTCNPIVSWYVVQQTVMISKAQMENLRMCYHVNESAHQAGVIITHNVRPCAPVNGRTIVAWPKLIDPTTQSSSSSSPQPTHSSDTPLSSMKSDGYIPFLSIVLAAFVLVAIMAYF